MKRSPAAAQALLAAETDAEHLARALVLWRCFYHETSAGGLVPSNLSCVAAEKALGLARKLGVTAEFMAALTEMPVMRVRVKKGVMYVEDLE